MKNVFSSTAKGEKNQLKVNTVQFWNKNYSCSFFFYDFFFFFFKLCGSPEFPWEIKSFKYCPEKKKKIPPYNRSHLWLLPKLQIRPQIIKRFDLLKRKSLWWNLKSPFHPKHFSSLNKESKTHSNYKLNSNGKIRNFHSFPILM